ncbi:MAG: threonine ammonia-lyase, biosynthetic, partial [Magnetococcales bacterium]|nr:threonine ammonia-lyase, biosynthetic [Magnetococcales bacterium]
ENWNISLFHYRMHGGVSGRVLVGLEVRKEENETLNRFLEELGFPYKEETANPAYILFL